VRRRFLILGWLIVLGLSAALPLSAIFQGVIHIGGHPLQFRQTLDRPLIAIGSDVTLDRGAKAPVFTLFGDIHLHGVAQDDLVALSGRIYLDASSRVGRDVLSILGGVYKARGASVSGRLGGALHRWDGRTPASGHNIASLLGDSVRLGLAAGLALLLAGTCLVVVFPWQIVLISSTLRGSPVKSVAAGVMILLTFAFLVVPLGLSLAGLPFALLLTAAAALAWLFGMAAAAVLVGRFLAHRPVSLLWAAAAGLVGLALVMAVPIVGPLLVTLTGLSGAGALAVALISRARPAVPLA
jgi:hypothetical protein